MAEQTVSPTPERQDDPPQDSGVAKWLKNAAAFVAVLSTIAGICFTAYQTTQTAKLNSDAEQNKLQLGREQLAAQKEARLHESSQHDEDLALEIRKHQLDIDQAKFAIKDADEKSRSDRLSALISNMFSTPQQAAEGDLAALFQFIGADQASIQTVENAVLAKLENPHSREEIDLGFRVLEQIGPSALDASIQANRSARAEYDNCLSAQYWGKVRAAGPPPSYQGGPDPNITAQSQVVATAPLDHSYAEATVKILRSRNVAPEQYLYFQPIADGTTCTHPLASEIIKRSNLAIMVQMRLEELPSWKVPRLVANFADTYLTTDIFGATESVSRFGTNMDMAYLGLDNAWYQLITTSDGRAIPSCFLRAKTTLPVGGIEPKAGQFITIEEGIKEMRAQLAFEKSHR